MVNKKPVQNHLDEEGYGKDDYRFMKYVSEERSAAPSWAAASHMSLDRFVSYGILGEGAFGVVHLIGLAKEASNGVRKLGDPNQHYFAMKILGKDKIVEGEMSKRVFMENECMKLISCNFSNKFCINLECSFQDRQNLYFILELAPGGSLKDLLAIYKKLDKEHCKFIAAQLVRALLYIHGLGIIHRDLKSDNILLTEKGNVKLSDFGSSTNDKNRQTFCGTINYQSPEMISEEGVGLTHAHDWWSLVEKPYSGSFDL